MVLLSYNGARKLPLLTLLALLLARQGLACWCMANATEERRASSADVLAHLGVAPQQVLPNPRPGSVAMRPRRCCCPAWNACCRCAACWACATAHSLVKLLDPLVHQGPRSIVGGQLHPPGIRPIHIATFALTGACALLPCGTGGRTRGRPAPHAADGCLPARPAPARVREAQGGPWRPFPPAGPTRH